MKNIVHVRNLALGEGIPKICVPVMGKTKEEVLAAARTAVEHEPDLIEWRADYFAGAADISAESTESAGTADISAESTESAGVADIFAGTTESAGTAGTPAGTTESMGVTEPVSAVHEMVSAQFGILCGVLTELRTILGDRPLLFTFRTKAEGGEQEISKESYRALLTAAAGSGQIDLLDVELFLGDEMVSALVEEAHANGVHVIASNHDFAATPPKEELIRRLRKMQELGADIAKIAVMPESRADVLTLLAATEECSRKLTVPLVTMSMGAEGAVSRLLGETFGSVFTFGMVGRPSAPGQISVEALRELLQGLHENLFGGESQPF